MKLGTESKKKTITACVLGGLAVILALNWMLNSGSSSQAAAPARVASALSPKTSDDDSAKTKRQAKKRDEKILASPWKPSIDPSLNLKMLDESESIQYKGAGRNIFDITSVPVIENPVKSALLDRGSSNAMPPQPPPKPLPPLPPPINLKFYGFSTRNGQKTVFLAQSPTTPDSVFVAHEGDIIARRYKVLRINPSSVEVQDLLSNSKQTINLSPG